MATFLRVDAEIINLDLVEYIDLVCSEHDGATFDPPCVCVMFNAGCQYYEGEQADKLRVYFNDNVAPLPALPHKWMDWKSVNK